MSPKSKHDCQFSIQRLAETSDQLFLWTFTFAEALAVSDAVKRWSRFLKDRHAGFTVSFQNCSDVRVFEMHPGRELLGHRLSHGLHIHMVLNRWLDVHIMRSKWERFGGGRINVRPIEKGKECYVAKYLGKRRS